MNKNILIILTLILAIYVLLKTQKKTEKFCLKVYTYSSFVDSWGAGKKINELFEKKNGCSVQFEDAGDSNLILERVRTDLSVHGKVLADAILGLDQFMLEKAKTITEWESLNLPISYSSDLPESHLKEKFLAYDWSPMAVVVKNSNDRMNNLRDLLDPKYKGKFSLMDPRTSGPGYIYLEWIRDVDPQNFEKNLNTLISNSVTVSPSWSAMYGLFKGGRTFFALTYLTSPVYHWIEEKKLNYQPLVFNDGHAYQIEYVGIPKKSGVTKELMSFLEVLYSKEGQFLLMAKNYMLPVISGVKEGTPYEKLPQVPLLKDFGNKSFNGEIIETWKKIQK